MKRDDANSPLEETRSTISFTISRERERERKLLVLNLLKRSLAAPWEKRSHRWHLGFGSGQRPSTTRATVPRHTPCTCVPPLYLYQFTGGSWGCSLCPGACPDGDFAQGNPPPHPPRSHGPSTREPSGIRSRRVRHPFALYGYR
jgi:hypothetical protein